MHAPLKETDYHHRSFSSSTYHRIPTSNFLRDPKPIGGSAHCHLRLCTRRTQTDSDDTKGKEGDDGERPEELHFD